jgi:glycosyltransferase involved in cell wall biosynthesis
MIPGGARGIDPIGDMKAGLAISAHIHRLNVAVVHASGLKTMFLCALARLGGPLPRVVSIVTGLGATYINDTPKTRLMRRGIEAVLRPLLRRPLTKVVFQNADDRAYFLERGVARSENSLIIKGSGVDTREFSHAPEPDGDPLVIFPARLLKSKGVLEFAAAATILSARGHKGRFALVGDLDPANPDALTPQELSDLVASGAVEAWGFRNDMAAVLAGCHVVCLPSYREGVPKALIEAASTGRPIVTTDVPGCREVVTDGRNGFVVPVRDAEALAEALGRLIESPELRQAMGSASRKRAEEEFDERMVIQQTVDLYGPPTR